MGPRERLTAHLKGWRGGFEWGERDCLTFTNAAWVAMYGHAWAADWRGRYMANGKPHARRDLRREFGKKSLPDAIDEKLNRIDGIPPMGALVTMKTPSILRYAMGISYGTRAAFLGGDGVVFAPIEQITGAWRER